MVDKYLYTTNNVVDRLVQGSRRILRSDSKRPENLTASPDHKKIEQKDQAAVRKLEKEMDMLTDPVLLHLARKDQQGLKEGTRSYAYKIHSG